MSLEMRNSAYLSEICEGLIEKADESIKLKSQGDYELGYAMAMYEVISLVHQQAQVFDLALSDLGLEGIDPERDYLCANSPDHVRSHQTSTRSTPVLWEPIQSMQADRIPSLVIFNFEASQLEITLQFSDHQKKLICAHVLCFQMIAEGCAFHTLANQKFDGQTWLLKTNHSALLDGFNVESESIYRDSIHAYVVVTQDQLFEFITDTDIQIK